VVGEGVDEARIRAIKQLDVLATAITYLDKLSEEPERRA
jgi:hypothetical protein